MSNTFSLSSPASAHVLVRFPSPGAIRQQPRGPGGLEVRLAQAFEAIRTCAGIAWWDGSAVGLRLHGLIGLFEADDLSDVGAGRETTR